MNATIAPTPQRDPRARLVSVVLFAGTWLLFSRALGHGLLDYDDPDFVTGNVHVRAGLTWSSVRWAFTSAGYAANWQPLTWLSLMLDRTIFGDRAWGFHATSITLHALNAALAFGALRRLTGAFWTSAIAAALFAWHPLRVESVAWISERKDVLSVGFGLASLWAYATYAARRRDGVMGAEKFYALTLATFICALLSKAMLVTLPCLFLLLDVWPLGRWRIGAIRALFVEKIPFLVASLASCLVTYAVQSEGGAVSHAFSFDARLGNAVISVARYLGKFLWPFDLAVCYPHPDHWPLAAIGAAVLLIAIITTVAWRQRRDHPWLLVGWLWFLGALVPVIGLVQSGMQAMADRYSYLPILGVELAALWTFGAILHSRCTIAVTATFATVMLIGCIARTWNQLGSWRDSHTLFEHALAVTEDNYLAHTFLASTLLNENKPDDAAIHAREAIAINPTYAPAHLGLGIALEKLGRVDAARTSYERALQLRPAFAPARYRLATLLLHRGDASVAASEFGQAIQLQPDFPSAHFGLALAIDRVGRTHDALAAVAHALELDPNYAEAHNTCANLLVALHRVSEAWPHYERAIQLNPAFAEAHLNYANALRESGRAEAACAHYRSAIALQPGDAEARFGLGVAFEELNRVDEAVSAYREAIARDPAHVEARYNLGVLLLNRGEFFPARDHFTVATRLRPTFAPAWLGLGIVAEQLGDMSTAISRDERALALDPNNVDAQAALGRVRNRVAQVRAGGK